MRTNSISDLLYAFEIADKQDLIDLYLRGILTQRDITKVSRYFLENLNEHHTVNGNVWNTMSGILNDFHKHQSISDKQAVFLIANLYENIDQRMPDLY